METRRDPPDGTTGNAASCPLSRLGYLSLWAAVGFLLAMGVASLPSIGWFVILGAGIVVIFAIIIAGMRGWAGFLIGVGLAGLVLAYLNRQEPGVFFPIFLGVGATAVAAGAAVEILARKKRVGRR